MTAGRANAASNGDQDEVIRKNYSECGADCTIAELGDQQKG
jgi:hypothetical protein